MFTVMIGDLKRKSVCADTNQEKGTRPVLAVLVSGNCWSVNSSRTQMVGENQYSETDATSEHLSACFPVPAVNLWVVGSSPKQGPVSDTLIPIFSG